MSWTIAFIVSTIIGIITWLWLKNRNTNRSALRDGDDTLGHLHIYVGTETGHSTILAETLAAEAKKYQFFPHIVGLEEFSVLEFKKHDYCVIICSTQIDGNPPENAVNFLKWVSKAVKNSNERLNSLSFSVFGLTKSSQNNTTAKKIYEGLTVLGANKIIKLGEGDENDKVQFQCWMKDLWSVLPAQAKASRRPAVQSSEFLEVAYQVPLKSPKPSIKYDRNISSLISSYELKVTKIKDLKRDPEYSALHIELETHHPYDTAGILAIYPENDEEIVREIAAIQGYGLEQTFQFVSSGREHPFPTPITVREALVRFCDLTSLADKKILKKLATFATDPEEQQKLEKLASLKGKGEYKTKLVETMVNLADVFKMFPSIKMPVGILVQVLDKIKPRYYNISSSFALSPLKLSFVVDVLRERTCEGKIRTGLCSGYIEKMHVTGLFRNIRGSFSPSKFKLPVFPSEIHMICNRCGLAAFKGLLQEILKQAQSGTETHQIVLYLGCKSKSTQFIFKQEIEKLISPELSKPQEFQYLPEKFSEGPFIVKKMFATFSRDQAQRKSMRDILFTQQENLWKTLNEKNGYVYVCGSASLGKNVKECIVHIANEHNIEEAAGFIEKITAQKRLIEAVWN